MVQFLGSIVDVSLFTMMKGVPYGEATVDGAGKPASFYVKEPAELETGSTHFRDCLVKAVE